MRADTDRSVDDAKLEIGELIEVLVHEGQARMGEASSDDQGRGRLLDVLLEGGELHLMFAPVSDRQNFQEIKNVLKLYDRGMLSHAEFAVRLDEEAAGLRTSAAWVSPGTGRYRAIVDEIERLRSMLFDLGENRVLRSDGILELEWQLPQQYVACRRRAVAALLESLLSPLSGRDLTRVRQRLAEKLAAIAQGDVLLATDDAQQELSAPQVQRVVTQGGELRLVVLAESDRVVLTELLAAIEQWHAGCLNTTQLGLLLDSLLPGLRHVSTTWSTRFYRTLCDLQITAHQQLSCAAQMKPNGNDRSEESRFLVEQLETMIHSPLANGFD